MDAGPKHPGAWSQVITRFSTGSPIGYPIKSVIVGDVWAAEVPVEQASK
jgi:hypothetical protein